MKKKLWTLIIIGILSIGLIGCGSSNDNVGSETSSTEVEWVEVIRFEGESIKDTETFNVSSKEWRIVWDTKPGNMGESNFQIYVYNEDGSPAGSFILANIIGEGNDTSYIRGSGDYYLSINTGQPYTIIIEEKK